MRFRKVLATGCVERRNTHSNVWRLPMHRVVWMSWRDKWEGKPFCDLQEVYAKRKGRTEGDISVNCVVLYIRGFTRYNWQQILLTWKITVVLHNSFMSPCVSFSNVFPHYRRCHKVVYKCVLGRLYICCQILFIYSFMLFPFSSHYMKKLHI